MILGAGIGSGFAFQESNEYLRKLIYNKGHERKKFDEKVEETFARRLSDLNKKYF